jgi:hypothetical protein
MFYISIYVNCTSWVRSPGKNYERLSSSRKFFIIWSAEDKYSKLHSSAVQIYNAFGTLRFLEAIIAAAHQQ